MSIQDNGEPSAPVRRKLVGNQTINRPHAGGKHEGLAPWRSAGVEDLTPGQRKEGGSLNRGSIEVIGRKTGAGLEGDCIDRISKGPLEALPAFSEDSAVTLPECGSSPCGPS